MAMACDPHDQTPPSFLRARDGGKIAYRATGGGSPGVLFLGGFRSDMTGTKASALEAHCRRTGRACVRFDYGGHGASDGTFADGTIGGWRDDALAVLDHVARGPQILVGSSMGGWIMLLAALARPERVAGLVGIAPAPDFTEELVWNAMDDDARQALAADGFIERPCDYGGESYAISRALIEEGRHHLLLGGPIALRCTIRLLQGMRDADVPWRTVLRLADRLESADLVVELVKDGDHRLSRPRDIARLCAAVDEVATAVETS